MRNSRRTSIAIQFATSRRGVPHPVKMRAWAEEALPTKDCVVCIRVVGTPESRKLNRQWRGKDKPTNVLSFPYAEAHGGRWPLADSGSLGDLVICAPIVAKEAREQGKTLPAHWAHMVVHGVLHLQGHDHVENRDAKKMENREVEILAHFGYQDPYLRSSGAPTAPYE